MHFPRRSCQRNGAQDKPGVAKNGEERGSEWQGREYLVWIKCIALGKARKAGKGGKGLARVMLRKKRKAGTGPRRTKAEESRQVHRGLMKVSQKRM